MAEMTYRRLGNSGMKVSVLSFGSWVSFDAQLNTDVAGECMTAAWDAGVNFFDNAEVYAGGKSETIMGEVIRQAGWDRLDYVISTKLYWGLKDGPNSRNTLNRKYLIESMEGSLERLQLDHVDLVYCHRPDPNTPIEETVRAMHTIVEHGHAHYWGTSEWSADEIRAAWMTADRLGLHKPQMEQPQYNLIHRDKVENEFSRLYEDIGLGTTIWSPLGSGALTGKYLDGIPEGSRATLDGYEWLRDRVTDPSYEQGIRGLLKISEELDCTAAQLALAWCAYNPNVSTVITGASKPEQVVENMKALDVLERLDDETYNRVTELFDYTQGTS